jgi:uncharacterized protein (DUF736 family)
MAITLGTFTKLDDGAYAGTFRTLNATATLAIVPVDRKSDKAPDYRVYGPNRFEIGAGWSATGKESGKEYINLKIGAPAFGPNWLRCRLVELDEKDAAGNTHIALWEPRD